MNKILRGPIFDVPVMDRRQREVLKVELAQLETQLRQHRASVEEWRILAARADRELDAPADLRERTKRRFKEKQALLAAGENLRAILIAELYSQPEYQPGFHYSH